MVNLAKTLSALVVLAALGVMPARAEILIATAGPMSGQYLSIGEQFRWGAEVAVADLNAAGGVLGEPVRLIIGDDACEHPAGNWKRESGIGFSIFGQGSIL
jgi:branched-chain amino acid transport system substrate-binding protein